MKFCHNCGAKLEDAEKFCSECGTLVADEEPAEKFVSNPEPPAFSPENYNPPAGTDNQDFPYIVPLIFVLVIIIVGGIFAYDVRQKHQEPVKEPPAIVYSDSDFYYVSDGDRKRNAGDYNGAIMDYQKAIELNPKNSDAYFGLGYCYIELKNPYNAKEFYQKCIELNPRFEAAFNNLGNIYFETGDYRSAISNYQKAVELNPRSDIVLNNLGNAYFKTGDYRSAISSYQKAVELNPNDASAYYNMGIAYERQGRYDNELSALNRAIELAPNNESYRTARDNVLNYLGTASAQTALENYYNSIASSRYRDAYNMLSSDLQSYYKSYSTFMEANSGIISVSNVREISSSSSSAVFSYRLHTVDYKTFAGTATLQKINNRWIIADLKIRET